MPVPWSRRPGTCVPRPRESCHHATAVTRAWPLEVRGCAWLRAAGSRPGWCRRRPRPAAICCTEGLLRVLDEAELRSALGHELAPVSGHDVPGSSLAAGLATVITFPAGLARLARPSPAGADPRLGALEHALMLL